MPEGLNQKAGSVEAPNLSVEEKGGYPAFTYASRAPGPLRYFLGQPTNVAEEQLKGLAGQYDSPKAFVFALAGGGALYEDESSRSESEKGDGPSLSSTDMEEYKNLAKEGYDSQSKILDKSKVKFHESVDKISLKMSAYKDKFPDVLTESFFKAIEDRTGKVDHLLDMTSMIINFKYTQSMNFAESPDFPRMSPDSLQNLKKLEQKSIDRINRSIEKLNIYLNKIASIAESLEKWDDSVSKKQIEAQKEGVENVLLNPEKKINNEQHTEVKDAQFNNAIIETEPVYKREVGEMRGLLEDGEMLLNNPGMIILSEINDYVHVLSEVEEMDEFSSVELERIKDVLEKSMQFHARFALRKGFVETFNQILSNLKTIGKTETAQKLLNEQKGLLN